MRTPRRNYSPLPEPETLKDKSGHTWNPEIYRRDKDGAPLYTKSGDFWLKPGKTHVG